MTKRTETWIGVGIVMVAGLAGVIAGLPYYMKSTAKVLHPEAKSVPSEAAQEPAPHWAVSVERAREAVRGALAEQNLPGLSVAVGVGGEIVWAEGFGWADIEKRAPVRPETRFRLGTLSQALTSVGVGILLEANRLKLDEPIQTYVPEFPKKQWPVTLRELMAQVAGVRNDGGDESPLFGQECRRPVEALSVFAESDLRFEPGTEFRSSNYGWILVSAALEKAAGMPFAEFMRREVFERAGMEDTAMESRPGDIPNAAKFYFPRYGADPTYGLHDMREIHLSCYAGAMAFAGTAADLARFGVAIQNGKLLKPETAQTLQTPVRLRSGEETGYGLGWDVETATVAGKQARVVGGDGRSLGGTVSSLVTLPEHGVVVGVVSNISYADTFRVAVKVAEAFVEQKAAPAQK